MPLLFYAMIVNTIHTNFFSSLIFYISDTRILLFSQTDILTKKYFDSNGLQQISKAGGVAINSYIKACITLTWLALDLL